MNWILGKIEEAMNQHEHVIKSGFNGENNLKEHNT